MGVWVILLRPQFLPVLARETDISAYLFNKITQT